MLIVCFVSLQLSVKHTDGSPAAAENVSIEFHDYTYQKHFSKIIATDSQGLVTFSLPPLDIQIKTLTLQVSSQLNKQPQRLSL